jgi:sarcosine oxidase delta subunit
MTTENKALRCPLCGSKYKGAHDLSGKLAALRSESEERTAKLDALEAYVLLAKSNEKETTK